jgi:type IV pilus assembly protein PilC
MQKFKYKIIDKNNRTREGQIEGEDVQRVGTTLLEQGFTILDLKPVGFSFEGLKNLNVGGVPFKDKVIFIRQMSFMINAGLPLTQALEVAQNQIQNFHFKDIVGEVLKDVQTGMALSKAMEKHPKAFDIVVTNLVKAGEESGKLDTILERVADDQEKKQEFNSKVKGALIYPVIILIAIIAVVALLLVFMIPQMSKLFEGSSKELPTATKIIFGASDFLRGLGGVFTLIVLITLVVSYVYYRRTPSGRIVTDAVYLRLPVFGTLMTKAQIASFARTFSMLITAGVPILDALKLVSESTTNYVFKRAIEDARTKVEKGAPLSQPILASEVFPPIVGHMVKVGEETGKIDEVIEKVGVQYAKEVDQMASNLTKLMEPIILIFMGIVVGILAIAVYLPIFNLGDVLTS